MYGLLSVVEDVLIIKSEACLATETQQLYPPFQSRVALTENLQNRQNSAVSLAPRHSILLF